jgi:hypothetical protein
LYTSYTQFSKWRSLAIVGLPWPMTGNSVLGHYGVAKKEEEEEEME